MMPEESRPDEVEQWMHRGHEDLGAATVLLRGGFVDASLFHCEQAAEDALKAFLALHGQRLPKTHDLSELGPLCSAMDTSLEELLANASDLSVYAVRFRYPGAPYQPDAAEAGEALELAASVVEEIERRLPPRCAK